MVSKSLIVYGVAPSGNSQKAMLGCTLMGITYDLRTLANLIGKEAEADGSAKSPAYLRINPQGTVPTLIDPNSPSELAADGQPQSTEGLVIDGSAGILVYLALKYTPSWYDVTNPIRVGRINNWMAFASNEIHHSLLKVRVSLKFGWDITPLTYPQAVAASHKTLAFLNSALEMNEKNGQNWLVEGSNPSIADIAVFPYVAFAEHSSDNEIQLSAYPAVYNWITRFKALPNYFMDSGAFF